MIKQLTKDLARTLTLSKYIIIEFRCRQVFENCTLSDGWGGEGGAMLFTTTLERTLSRF